MVHRSFVKKHTLTVFAQMNALSLTICFILLEFVEIYGEAELAIIPGNPEIICGMEGVALYFTPETAFDGVVSVKNLFAVEGCRSEKEPQLNIPFGKCGLEYERSLNPPGVFLRSTIIVSATNSRLSKNDRSFQIQCFYMEANKTVDSELEVQMLTTQLQTHSVPMPVCQYEILDGPGGSRVRYTVVGQPVYHRWTCLSESANSFCMIVHSCNVGNEEAGENTPLLDEEGCAVDKYLLRNLEYTSDLQAGQEAHVFKYPEEPLLHFDCQVTITFKDIGNECPLPVCDSQIREKRSPRSRVTTTATLAHSRPQILSEEEFRMLRMTESEFALYIESQFPGEVIADLKLFCITNLELGMLGVFILMSIILVGILVLIRVKTNWDKIDKGSKK